MNIPDKNTRYQNIAAYLAGEMDAAQEKDFKQLLNTDPNTAMAFSDLEKYWNVMQTKHTLDPDHTQMAWETLRCRIQQEGLLPNQPSQKRSVLTSLKWAATILIFITVGTIAYFGLRTQAPAMISIYNDDEIPLVHTLNDATVIYLSQGTRIDYPEVFDNKKRTVQLWGEAFFDVSHQPDNPFEIETPDAIIEVLGTSFNVNTRDNLEVFVETGLVRVSRINNHNDMLQVEKGEILTLTQNKLEKQPVHAQYSADWRKHRMQFKDESLDNIIAVINQNYDSRFVILDPEISQRRLTVTFYNNSVPVIAELISLSLNIHYEIMPDSSIVFKTHQ